MTGGSSALRLDAGGEEEADSACFGADAGEDGDCPAGVGELVGLGFAVGETEPVGRGSTFGETDGVGEPIGPASALGVIDGGGEPIRPASGVGLSEGFGLLCSVTGFSEGGGATGCSGKEGVCFAGADDDSPADSSDGAE